jgi:hypothetical protein
MNLKIDRFVAVALVLGLVLSLALYLRAETWVVVGLAFGLVAALSACGGFEVIWRFFGVTFQSRRSKNGGDT